jgi:hypothetical protein
MKKILISLTFVVMAGLLSPVLAAGKNPDKSGGSIKPSNLKKTLLRNKLIGADDNIAKSGGGETGEFANAKSFYTSTGSRGLVTPDTAIGIEIGSTTYDHQHNSRCTRQVAWRGDHTVHFAWIKKNSDYYGPGTFRMTSYQNYDPTFPGYFRWHPIINFGGKDIHVDNERSAYCGIDVLPTLYEDELAGRAVVYNHYRMCGIAGCISTSTIWPDLNPGLGSFSAYKQCAPRELRQGAATDLFYWPYLSTQIYNNDTIMHMLSRVYDQNADFSEIRYFRRVGPVNPDAGDPPGSDVSWTGFTVDTINAISHVVECATEGVASGYEGKTAIVWSAHWPAVPGGSESETAGLTGNLSYLVEQCQNDIYCMISMDGGNTWENIGDGSALQKHNCSRVDSTEGGYVPLGDIGALIDSDGRLHIVWAARPTGALEPGKTGATAVDWEWPRFPFASRILHWSDDYLNDPNETDYISVIKDMTLDWTPYDTICFGGAWHEMSLNQPQMTQCDDKLYCVWAQFQDLENGVWDDCDVRNFTQFDWYGSANSQLYFSVSSLANGGLNRDPAHQLTVYVGRCDTLYGSLPSGPYCHSHFWPSVARTGMLIDEVEDDFGQAEIVEDGAWTYSSIGWYFDVTYVDDRNPGAAVQGESGWTRNPMRWFRVPCIEPDLAPQLAIDPLGIFEPTWYKPGGSGNDEEVTLINTGNSLLTVSDVTLTETDGPVSNWLAVDKTTASIVETVPSNTEPLTVTINDNGIIDGGLYGYHSLGWRQNN